MKHAVLCRVLTHLRGKPGRSASSTPMPAQAFTISAASEAGKTLEWQRRHRPADARPSSTTPVRALLAPYLDAVAALNPAGALAAYPGSPALAQSLLRSQDRLVACELEPQAAAALSRELARRRPRQGDRDRRLDRADRLRAAEGAARPGADRSAVRAARRIFPAGAGARRRAPQMADRALPALVSRSRTTVKLRRSCGNSPGSGIAKMLRVELIVATAAAGHRFARQRAHRGQSALDLARRDQCPAAGAWRAFSPAVQRAKRQTNGSRANCRAEAASPLFTRA